MPSNRSKPANVDEFITWARRKLKVNFDATSEKEYYRTRTERALAALTASPFWVGLNENKDAWSAEFKKEHNGLLLPDRAPIEPVVKPFSSVVDKAFRKNVLQNSSWPDPPSGGWVLPDNCINQLNDILRATVCVRFLDGVLFMERKLAELASVAGVPYTADKEAKSSGYHAIHAYITPDLPIVDRSWQPCTCSFTVEIQLRTTLQKTLWELTHSIYEGSRLDQRKPATAWEFEEAPVEFAATYIGHQIQYLEAALVTLRKQSTDSHQ